eukprot:5227479-Prymnesium_polylepis.2
MPARPCARRACECSWPDPRSCALGASLGLRRPAPALLTLTFVLRRPISASRGGGRLVGRGSRLLLGGERAVRCLPDGIAGLPHCECGRSVALTPHGRVAGALS